jgi:hypothetical protein
MGARVTQVFESANSLVPQQYAGDATYTTEVDNAAKAVGNKYTGYVLRSLLGKEVALLSNC